MTWRTRRSRATRRRRRRASAGGLLGTTCSLALRHGRAQRRERRGRLGQQRARSRSSIIASNAGGNCSGDRRSQSRSPTSRTAPPAGSAPAQRDPAAGRRAVRPGRPDRRAHDPGQQPRGRLRHRRASIGIDQRGYTRSRRLAPCDAGAYEQSGTPTGAASRPRPPPHRRTPDAAVRRPRRRPPRTPVANRRSSAEEVKGTVLVKVEREVRRRSTTDVITNGSEIDTRKGDGRRSRRPTGEQGEVLRRHLQGHPVAGLTTLTLTEALDCSKRRRASARGREEAQDAQAVGRRQGQVPHQGQVQRRHRPRHQVARQGHVHDHDRPGHAGRRARSRTSRRSKKVIVRKGKPYVGPRRR